MRYYLDTSALVKRYITEPGSDMVDQVFENAWDGKDTIIISYFNIGEAATVFDKFSRRTNTPKATKLIEEMLDEFKELHRYKTLEISDITNAIIDGSIPVLLKHHLYIVDSVQITTAKGEHTDIFLSADRRLVDATNAESIKAKLVGSEFTATKS